MTYCSTYCIMEESSCGRNVPSKSLLLHFFFFLNIVFSSWFIFYNIYHNELLCDCTKKRFENNAIVEGTGNFIPRSFVRFFILFYFLNGKF